MNNKERGKSNSNSKRGGSKNTGAPKFSGRKNFEGKDSEKYSGRNDRNEEDRAPRRRDSDSGSYTGPKNKSNKDFSKSDSIDRKEIRGEGGSYRERRASELGSGKSRDSRNSGTRNRSRSSEGGFEREDRGYSNKRSDSDSGKSRGYRSDERKPFSGDKRRESRDSGYSSERGEKRSYRKDGDSRDFNRDRGEKPSYRKDGDSRSFGRDNGEKRSYRKEGDSKDFSRDRGEKPSYRKDGDSRDFNRNRGEKKSYRSDDRNRDKKFGENRGEKKTYGSDRRDEDRGKRFERKDSRYEKSDFREREDKRRPKTREYKNKDRESIGDWRNDRPESSLRPETKEKEFRGGNPITEPVRLNKFISNAGICSRREADQHIENGAVTVNGVVVMELGAKVNPGDEVRFKTRLVLPEKPVYVLMNKPKDCITSSDDPEGRRTVLDLIGDAVEERIFPVGRLDRNTTGVLLLTNDGDLAQKLTHPSYGIQKIYKAELDKPMSSEDFDKLQAGVDLEDGFIKPDELAYLDDSGSILGIEIHSGKNHIVHRMFNSLGYLIEKLDRVSFAGLTKDGLKRGEIRMLSEKDLLTLRKSVGKAGMNTKVKDEEA